MLSPDYYYRSVRDIDLVALRSRGVDTLLMDLDNTLIPRTSGVIPPELKQWVAELAILGFRVYVVSNNWHRRVKAVADELGVGLVARAVKPLPFAFLKAVRDAESHRSRAAIIGDQMFTDILGGKLTGMVTVLVQPVSQDDHLHTRLLRRIEQMLLAGRRPLP